MPAPRIRRLDLQPPADEGPQAPGGAVKRVALCEYDLAQEFSRAGQGAINEFRERDAAVRRSEADAIRAAEQSVYENPLNRPVEGTAASLVEGWQEKYGQPVRQGADGKLYVLDAAGNPIPFVPPAPTAPSPATSPTEGGAWVDLLARTLSGGQKSVAI